MKNTLLLLFLSLFFLNSFSQDFATSDAKWVYDFNGAWFQGITKIYYEKDTLVGTRQCTKFMRELETSPGNSSVLGPVFFYNDNGRIEFSFNAVDFDLLFNFRAGVGSTWQVYRRLENGLLIDSFQVSIDVNTRSTINGKSLRMQIVTYSNPRRRVSYQEVIYESIGPSIDYLFPWDQDARARDGGEGGPVRCFHNNELGLVELDTSRIHSGYVYECDQLVSINGIPIPDYQLEFYPNPVRDKLQIESYETSKLNIEIVDMLGRRVKQVEIIPGDNDVDMSSFSTGIYLMSIEGRVVRRVLKN